MVHDPHAHYKWYVFIIFHVSPRAYYGCIWYAFIPIIVWRFSNTIFSTFRCRKLALNRKTSYIHIGIDISILGTYMEGWYVCLSIHPLVCTSVCMPAGIFVIGMSTCP